MKALRSGAILLSLFVSTVAWAREAPLQPNYPARYMRGDANLIAAPWRDRLRQGARSRQQGLVHGTTVDNLGDGIWVIGGYSIA